MSRRARALALLGMAAVCAGLAASIVNGYARDVRAQVGPLTPVLVARTQVPKGKRFTPANISRYLTARRVPVHFVPPRSYRFASDVVGLQSLTPIPSGSYLSEGQLVDGSDHRVSDTLKPNGARVVEVSVAGATALESMLRPGDRVDVLITSERGPGPPRTYLALQRIEVAALRSAGIGNAPSGEGQETLVSLQVTLRQAVLLTAAENFARELRLIPRVSGEDRRVPPTVVSAQNLRP